MRRGRPDHGVEGRLLRDILLRGGLVARIDGAAGDPGFEVADRGGVELRAVPGHLELGLLVADDAEDLGRDRIELHDRFYSFRR